MELKRKVTETEILKTHGGKGLNPAAREFKSAIVQSDDGNVGNHEDNTSFPTLHDQTKKVRNLSETHDSSMDEIEEGDDSGFVTVTRKKGAQKGVAPTPHRERLDSFKENAAPVKPTSKSYDCLDDFDDDLPTKRHRKTSIETVPDTSVEDWVNGSSGGPGIGIDSIDEGDDAVMSRPSSLGRLLMTSQNKMESAQSPSR